LRCACTAQAEPSFNLKLIDFLIWNTNNVIPGIPLFLKKRASEETKKKNFSQQTLCCVFHAFMSSIHLASPHCNSPFLLPPMSDSSTTACDHAWEEVEDSVSRRTLFYNKSTGVTTFEKPDELKNMDERKRVRML
jgi:hypothetical protein